MLLQLLWIVIQKYFSLIDPFGKGFLANIQIHDTTSYSIRQMVTHIC